MKPNGYRAADVVDFTPATIGTQANEWVRFALDCFFGAVFVAIIGVLLLVKL
jgi:hypothetical protein